ncbi:hypothetical protein NK8_74660 (plasmid) [Caballeronia sp. NK8]|uniref:hypothetical protein n=1 Tax=Caballeronia sp. NK8 TaxID=140098 RepID=UPI001BB6BD2F|nr:hypothetical protein [Caballeronia sp. NK8]BCQ29276.1 hypothetical protein NK8_74660 [Caballeronia sp. NK8]
MTFAKLFSVRTLVFENGERMPLLMSTHGGMPVFDACVYATSRVRPKSGSAATIEQALRGVQLLLTFTSQRHIDLHQRFSSAQFLDVHELDELVRAAYGPRSSKGGADSTGRCNTSDLMIVIQVGSIDDSTEKALVGQSAAAAALGALA